MYFVIVIVLAVGDGVIVTMAKEVQSRRDCDVVEQRMRERFPSTFAGAVCERWVYGDDD